MKNIIITGSNSGIGKEAALILAKEGHCILMLSRDSEKSKQAHQEILAESGNENVFLIPVDLSDQDSIRNAVAEIKSRFDQIDVLVNNAGVVNMKRIETDDGIEENFAVNFLAPYILSELLLEKIAASEEGRIINLISDLFKRGTIDLDNLMLRDGYRSTYAFANSKLALLLYTINLAHRTEDQDITVNALHPGTVATSLFRDFPGIILKFMNLFAEKPQKGGQRIAYLATSDEMSGISGKYFFKDGQKELDLNPQEKDKSGALFAIAEELTLDREDVL